MQALILWLAVGLVNNKKTISPTGNHAEQLAAVYAFQY